MKALILGCSHAAGAEMHKDASVGGVNPDSFGWLNSYPVLISQQLGYQPLNYAISGGSNDAMFRIFTEQLSCLTADDIIIACWTGIDRTEIWHDLDQQWLPLCVGKHNFYPYKSSTYALSGLNTGGKISSENEYQHYHEQWNKFHVNHRSGKLNKLKNIIALNVLAQQHSIRVININSFNPIEHTDNLVWAFDESFCVWADQHQYYRTEWGHYFLSTHQAFADAVIDNLNSIKFNCKL